MRKQQILLACKVTNILKPAEKREKPICRFGFPLPPFPRTMLLYPLEENVDKYKKNTELLKAMNEYNVDMTFEEFLENIAKMDFEDYIKCIRSSFESSKSFLKTKNKGYEDKLV